MYSTSPNFSKPHEPCVPEGNDFANTCISHDGHLEDLIDSGFKSKIFLFRPFLDEPLGSLQHSHCSPHCVLTLEVAAACSRPSLQHHCP